MELILTQTKKQLRISKKQFSAISLKTESTSVDYCDEAQMNVCGEGETIPAGRGFSHFHELPFYSQKTVGFVRIELKSDHVTSSIC